MDTIRNTNMSARQVEIVMGTLLGDGCIKGRSKTRRYLSISHSDKQKDYIMWLYNGLQDLCPSSPKPYISKNKYITYTLITKPREEFFELRNKLYIPQKTVSEWWLSFITPLSVAVWYMDDGCLNYKNKQRSYFSFATNSFSVEENYLLKNMMNNKFGIKTEVDQFKRGEKYQCNLVVLDESFNDFVSLVQNCMTESMLHKLPGEARQKKIKTNIDTDITKKELERLYFDERLTQKEIGEIYGVHRLTISKYMKVFNVQPRDNTTAQLNGKNNGCARGSDGRFYARTNSLEESQKTEIIFKNLRRIGFPYPQIQDDEKYIAVLERLLSKECQKGDANTFQYSRAGLKIVSDLCPQIFSMASKNSLSPLEIFNNDRMLIDCIKRTIKFAHKDTIAAVRSGLKTYKSNRCVTNFPPLWTKAIINEIGEIKSMLDFSSGFGGRLIGSYVSGVNHYTGIDPLESNIESQNSILSLIQKHCGFNDRTFNANLIQSCAENEIHRLNFKYDLILTSPPYFDKEKYDSDNKQCYNKYYNYNLWLNEWLYYCLNASYKLLNKKGVMAIFMGNSGKHNVKKDCKHLMENLAGSKVKEYYFLLPQVEYNRLKSTKNYDTCFVITKDK